MKSEGVTVKPLRELTGNAMFNTVYIDDVFVPDECVLGEVNRGWEVSRNTLTAERVSIGSSDANFLATLARVRRVRSRRAVRPGRATPGRAVDRRGPRRQGAEPALDAVDAGRRRRHAVGGDLQAVVDAHRPGLCRIRGVLVRHRRRDRRHRTSHRASGARYLLASRATTIYGGTSEVQLNIIAERLLGLPRDP